MGKLRRPVVTPDSCLTATRPSAPSETACEKPNPPRAHSLAGSFPASGSGYWGMNEYSLCVCALQQHLILGVEAHPTFELTFCQSISPWSDVVCSKMIWVLLQSAQFQLSLSNSWESCFWLRNACTLLPSPPALHWLDHPEAQLPMHTAAIHHTLYGTTLQSVHHTLYGTTLQAIHHTWYGTNHTTPHFFLDSLYCLCEAVVEGGRHRNGGLGNVWAPESHLCHAPYWATTQRPQMSHHAVPCLSMPLMCMHCHKLPYIAIPNYNSLPYMLKLYCYTPPVDHAPCIAISHLILFITHLWFHC